MDQQDRDQLRSMIIQAFKESLRGGLPQGRQPDLGVRDEFGSSVEQEMLLRALPLTPDNAKWNVIRRLGEVGDFSAIPALMPFLAHSRLDLQKEAREAIGEIEQRVGSRYSPPPAPATVPPPPSPVPRTLPPTPAPQPVSVPPPAAPAVKQRPPRPARKPIPRGEVSASEAATTGYTDESRDASRALVRDMLATTVVAPYRSQPVAGWPDLPDIGEIAEVGLMASTMPELPVLADLPPAYGVAPPPA